MVDHGCILKDCSPFQLGRSVVDTGVDAVFILRRRCLGALRLRAPRGESRGPRRSSALGARVVGEGVFGGGGR